MASSMPAGRSTSPPTGNDYIRAIANGIPAVCGGGVFEFHGFGGEGLGFSAFKGKLNEYDSGSGPW